MTKNEIIRDLSSSDFHFVCRLTIVYHDKSNNVIYTFGYENSPVHVSSQFETSELICVLNTLYRMSKFIVDIHATYYSRNSDGYLEKRVEHYTSNDCPQYVNSIYDFIKTSNK